MPGKYCGKCETSHPISEFNKNKKEKDGLQAYCKGCMEAYRTKRASTQKHKDMLRSSSLKKRFGIDLNEYQQMWDEQEGLCSLCGEPETFIHHQTNAPAWLAVDHCHTSGKIRSLLCRSCNVGLGQFKDNPQLLRAAAAYVEKHIG